MTSGIKAPVAPRWQKSALKTALLGAMALALFNLQPTPTTLQEIHAHKQLTLVAVGNPGTILQQDINARGLQFDLAQRFADQLGVPLNIVSAPDNAAAVATVRDGKADLAIASLTPEVSRVHVLHLGQPLQAAAQEVVTRADQPQPASIEALGAASVAVAAGSPEAEQLKQLAQAHPAMKVVEVSQANPIKLLDMVNNRQVDYAVVNTIEFDSRHTLFPDLVAAKNLTDRPELAWAFRASSDPSLEKAAQRFLDRMQADGSLQRLASFYGQSDSQEALADDASLQEFHEAVASRLPHYRKLFEQNAQHTNMDWRLLAAIAYQESKWQATAVSPTGVQGMMMLTQSTADYLDVGDRANANQSIRGGAEYYQEIVDSLPDTVHEPDRTWMALAAYNMGPGYLERARTLTDMAGDDADKWLDVSSHLTEMVEDSRRAGHPLPPVGQALSYVQEVRRYYDALLLNSDNDTRVAMVTHSKPPQH